MKCTGSAIYAHKRILVHKLSRGSGVFPSKSKQSDLNTRTSVEPDFKMERPLMAAPESVFHSSVRSPTAPNARA